MDIFTQIIVITLGGTLLVAGKLWIILGMLSFKWIDLAKVRAFIISKGASAPPQRRKTDKIESSVSSSPVVTTKKTNPENNELQRADLP